MKILGLSLSPHDRSAALVVDGKVKMAIEEERLSRIRHCVHYDDSKYNLDDDAEYFSLNFSRLDPAYILNKINDLVGYFSKGKKKVINEFDMVIGSKLLRANVEYKNYINIDHHLAHAAHAFFTSPYKKAAILIMDGCGNEINGDYDVVSLFVGKNNKIELVKKVTGRMMHQTKTIIGLSNSIGVLYSNTSALCGFGVYGTGKLMGLAAYGNPKFYDDLIKLCVKNHGQYSIDNLGIYNKIKTILDSKENQSLTQDIASSIQKIAGEIILYYAKELRKITGEDNICLAGGVALNGTSNNGILNTSGFKRIYIPSAPGDDGISIGAALYGYFQISNKKRIPDKVAPTPYLGYKYTNKDVEFALNKFANKVEFKKHAESTLLNTLADLLLENKIIAWFQGSSEFGPRALGNRSLIASPLLKENKDRLNEIKSREFFRPVAPVLKESDLTKYFSVPKNGKTDSLSYMLFNLQFKDRLVGKVAPAIVHADNTARAQTLNIKQNRLLYKLIEKFKEKTGTGILTNTSFNTGGEPIVETPEQAILTFISSEIDCLVLNNYIVTKR
jgi:carbamoyltransferase